MSTSTIVKVSKLSAWLDSVKQDQASVRALRFAVGITLTVALAYGINWPLSFLLPVITTVILSLPLPRPSLSASLENMLNTIKAFAIGLVFSLFFLQYPFAYILMLGLVLFHLYYYLNRGGSFWFTLMSMISILLLPMLANSHEGLAIGISFGFVFTGLLAVIMVWISYLLVPDPQAAKFPKSAGFKPGYSQLAAITALKSTMVIYPMASLFIILDLSGYILVMIFSAIFILKPELSAGKAAGQNSLISTLLGGVCALVFYWLIVAVPEYTFYIVLMFLTTLIFGRNIFSTKPTAKYYSSAFIALLILINGSMAEGASFTELFIMRVLLISMAIIYIVVALKTIDSFWPEKN